MIKFFRHIRRSLINQNQTSPNDSVGRVGKPSSVKTSAGKYFKYAIGEILLVVIGILIALQINNWNEERKLNLLQKKLIADISSEIKANIETLEIEMKFQDSITRTTEAFLKKVNQENLTYTNQDITGYFNYASFSFETDALDDALGSNSRSLITDDATLKELRRIKRQFQDNKDIVRFMDEFWNNQVTEYYVDSGSGLFLRRNILGDTRKRNFKINDQLLSLLNMMNLFQSSWNNKMKVTKKILVESLQKLEYP